MSHTTFVRINPSNGQLPLDYSQFVEVDSDSRQDPKARRTRRLTLDERSRRANAYRLYIEEAQEAGLLYLSPSWGERVKELDEYDQMIAQRLAMRAFHLPGNDFWEDWHQFLGNNHPVFGFCLADPRHPFGTKERLINLMGSLAFGLAATSCVVLWYFYREGDPEQVILDVWVVEVQHQMLMLVIFGGMLHVLFDLGIWFIQACPCLRGPDTGRYVTDKTRKFCLGIGSHIAIELTVVSILLAAYCILVRASIEEDGDDVGFSNTVNHYLFVLTYALETFISQFILFPIVAFTIFTGVLGCGRIPGIGGRPYQVWRLERRRLAQQAEEFRQSNNFENISRESLSSDEAPYTV